MLIVPDGTSAIKSTAAQKMPAFADAMRVRMPSSRAPVGVLCRDRRDHHPGNRATQDYPGQVRHRDRWEPHCGPAVRHQRGEVRLDLYIIVGLFAAAARGLARASYIAGGSAVGRWHETNCLIRGTAGWHGTSGGEGSVLKTAVSALIIICVTTGLMTVIPSYWQNVAKGGVMLAPARSS